MNAPKLHANGVIPSIISADPLFLGDAIDQVEGAGADWLHIDVMDGSFVPDITFGARMIRQVRRRTRIGLDVHLQVDKPERYLDTMIEAGVEMVSVHVETTPHISLLLRKIARAGLQPGVAVNPGTPLASIEEVLEEVTQVTLMMSSPGTSDFVEHSYAKISRLRSLLERRGLSRVKIAVDAGITVDRAEALVRAGADLLIAGSAVFSSAGGIAAGMQELRARSLAATTADRRIPVQPLIHPRLEDPAP